MGTGALGAAGVPAAARRVLRAGGRRPPIFLLLPGLLVGLAALLPAGYLTVVVGGDLHAAADVALSRHALQVAGRTMGLAAAVVAAATAIALPLAWLTTRTDLPARRLWVTLCTLPLVVPTYVGAYLLVAALGPGGLMDDAVGAAPGGALYGFWGAWVVLTLFTYPLVLIPLRSSLRRIDPQLEQAARSLGRTPRQVFASVVLPQLRPALAAGGLLVALFVFSDFGAVSLLRFDTFTSEIYLMYTASLDRTGAAAFGAVLALAMVALLAVSASLGWRRTVHRVAPGPVRGTVSHPLGRWRWPALGFCAAVVAVALVLPVAVLAYWSTRGIAAGSMPLETLAALAANSFMTAAAAAAAGGAGALVVALLVSRFPGAVSRAVDRLAHVGYALPGIVVALALVFFATRAVPALYQTMAVLVLALTVHYLPLAIGPGRAALAQVPPRLEEAARGLGRTPAQAFRTVTVPLVRGGVLAGVALVFLHAIKELPITLILAPLGFETLATEIWEQSAFGFYEATALPALALLLVAAPPLYLLSERGSVDA